LKTSDLAALTRIASRISNPGSLTSLYRAIELGPDSFRACSEFGNIFIATENTGLEKPVLLDCSAVMSVALSLPQSSEVTLTQKDSKVSWKCENARGSFNTVQTDHSIPEIKHDKFPWIPTPNLGDALNLASCACQAAAVSLGLYGIIGVADGDKLRFMSTNTTSLAEAVVDKGTFPGTKITLRPPVPSIIAGLIGACKDCKMDVTEKEIYIEGSWLRALLPLSTNITIDLKSMADKFKSATQVAKVNSAAVRRFITRARALSDRHTSFTVALSVKDGKMSLSHSGISAALDEFFICENLDPKIEYASVALPADLMLIALPFVSEIVFDYLPDQRIVLRGENPTFSYIIAGGD
jgi:hypothetical protein